MPQRSGTPWTAAEIAAIVDAYVAMLWDDLSGKPFVKADRNRKLQALTGRSRPSIEFKLRNISAVMAEFGLPFIRGYLPAKNYQRGLFEAIEAHLSQDGLLSGIAVDLREMVDVPAGGIIEQGPPPPPEPTPTTPMTEPIQRILRRFDPAERDARARKLGEEGERFLFQAEQNRLSAKGRDDLAKLVRWVSKEDGDGAGYDILSFSVRGDERWLEVKTTNGPKATPFWISENERRVSEARRDVYRLARLYDFSKKPEMYCLRPPLTDHVHLTPTQYRATF